MKHKRLLLICILAACFALATQAWALNPPTNVQAARGNAMAAVSFTAPAGSITGYTVTASDGTTATGTASPIVVRGLTNGTVYTFTVTATDGTNTSSASSASNAVKPVAHGFAVYAGTWHGAAISTGGSGVPWGQMCTQTLSDTGSLSMDCTDVNGQKLQMTDCHIWIFPYGMTATCDSEPVDPSFLCYLNTASTTTSNGAVATVGTVMACTESATVDGVTDSTLTVSVRQGGSYTTSDMYNTNWYGEGLAVQASEPDFWEQEISSPVSVDGSGNVSGSGIKSNGSTIQMGGTMSLASTGLLTDTISGKGTVNFYLDSGQNVACGFTGYSPGDNVELSVLSKKGTNYTLSDLAGYWAGNKIRTDGKWQRMVIQVNPDGTFVTSEIDSNGSPDSGSGQLKISSGGEVTCASGSCAGTGFDAVMDASKTVITETQTKTNSGGSSYSMLVLTKVKAPWANSVVLGNGWVWLRSYGYLYTGDAPWIYFGQTHGWLYPFEDISSGSNWFWDWNMNTFWWTNQQLYPYLLRADNGHWLWYKNTVSGSRTFIDLSNGNKPVNYNMN